VGPKPHGSGPGGNRSDRPAWSSTGSTRMGPSRVSRYQADPALAGSHCWEEFRLPGPQGLDQGLAPCRHAGVSASVLVSTGCGVRREQARLVSSTLLISNAFWA